MGTANGFELVETKALEGFDLFFAMTLSVLIPLELRFKMRSLHINKYTKDAIFMHQLSFARDPVIGVQIVIEDDKGKKYQSFVIFEGVKNNPNNSWGWSIKASSGFSEIEKVEKFFPTEEIGG